jgi:ribose 5-phosphate isomerase A
VTLSTGERVARLAHHVATEFESGMTLGLGSGSTAEAVVRAIGARMSEGTGFRVTGVATSIRTQQLAESLGIPIIDLSAVSSIELGFDGADEIDPRLDLVKGRGGALLYEKLVAEICRDYVVVSTSEKLVERLGTRLPLPVEIIPYGWRHTADRISRLGLAPVLREKDGEPLITDAGHLILDCAPSPGLDLSGLALHVKSVTGVVEHGVFPNIARRAAIVDPDGSIRTVLPA